MDFGSAIYLLMVKYLPMVIHSMMVMHLDLHLSSPMLILTNSVIQMVTLMLKEIQTNLVIQMEKQMLMG
jgi:hypothetical protein